MSNARPRVKKMEKFLWESVRQLRILGLTNGAYRDEMSPESITAFTSSPQDMITCFHEDIPARTCITHSNHIVVQHRHDEGPDFTVEGRKKSSKIIELISVPDC